MNLKCVSLISLVIHFQILRVREWTLVVNWLGANHEYDLVYFHLLFQVSVLVHIHFKLQFIIKKL